MDKHLFQLANELAERRYQIMTFLDKTTEGKPVYVSLVRELPGCASHGATIDEAVTSLKEAMVEFTLCLKTISECPSRDCSIQFSV